ncbi:MAG TPA: RNA polymerase sigma factor [Gammaproteobacteria bacterium]
MNEAGNAARGTVTAPSDTELMREVRGGRAGALAPLFERHHARLYRFCLRMTGNRPASEDLVQDVFMRMLKYSRTFKDEMSFLPWMFRIARNACVDHLRRAAADRMPAHAPDEIESEEPTPDESGAPDDRAELIRKALLALPAERREVLLLSRYEFKSYEEIARTLGCSVGAVKVRAHRAIKQLREVYLELSRQEAAV